MSEYIPEDILINVLSRLPVKTLLQARCVSKTWNSLIKSPPFITHHLIKKATSKNNDLLFFKRYYMKGNLHRYFLYQEKDFPECSGEELDFPLEKLDMPYPNAYTTTTLVGSCNGIFCIFDAYFDSCNKRYAHRATLWNPSIRKVVSIPGPSVTFQSHKNFLHCFGFGFDSISHDYKLVRLVYLQQCKLLFPPLVEAYSKRSGCWRMVENDLQYAIEKDSRSAFVNGACHWTTVNHQTDRGTCALNVIVLFNLADERIGEMRIPEGVVLDYNTELTVAVFDGLLSLVALSPYSYRGTISSIWSMKKYGDEKSWTKLFNIEHLTYAYVFVGFKKNGELLLGDDGQLIAYSKTKNGSCKIWGTEIRCSSTMFLDSYMESLVLLDEASSTSTGKASGSDADGVSKEHSSSGLDKNKREKKKKGEKNEGGPEIVGEENRVSDGDASTSAISRSIASNEGQGAASFGAKNRKQKEKKNKKKGTNHMDCTEEENDFPSSSSTAGKKNKKKKGKTNKNE